MVTVSLTFSDFVYDEFRRDLALPDSVIQLAERVVVEMPRKRAVLKDRSGMTNSFPLFLRGERVVAVKDISFGENVDVPAGTKGVVFEEAEFHEAGTGPMVYFNTGYICNVYDGYVKTDR